MCFPTPPARVTVCTTHNGKVRVTVLRKNFDWRYWKSIACGSLVECIICDLEVRLVNNLFYKTSVLELNATEN